MSDHEIYSLRSNSARLAYSGGEMKAKESDFTVGFAVRAIAEGRVGFSHCQKEDQITRTIEDAQKLARFGAKSAFSFAPKSDAPAMNISDPVFETPDFEMLRNYVEDTKNAVESKGGKARVISSIESALIGIENTSGFSGQYRRTAFSMYAECMHGDGFGYSYLVSHHP